MIRAQKIMDIAKDTSRIRNIAICAHIDHGKTTLADSLLWAGGLLSKTLAGHTRQLDFREDEIERGITIDAISASFPYSEHIINVVDTPGHVDFGGEVTRTMRAVEGAIVVCCAVEGIMPQTETVLLQALKENVKPILFINKVDRLITETKNTPAQMITRFQEIIDAINTTIEKIKPEWTISAEKGNVIFGSAIDKWALSIPLIAKSKISLKSIIEQYTSGKKEFDKQIVLPRVILDSVIEYIPNPVIASEYRFPTFWNESAPHLEKEDVCAVVTKVEHIDETSYATIRIFNGTLSQKAQDLRTMQTVDCNIAIRLGSKFEKVLELYTGMIGVLINAKVRPGDTLSTKEILPMNVIVHAFEPVISKSIETVDPKLIEKLPIVLEKVANEDPGLIISVNHDTGEYIISGLGELHLTIIEERINKELEVKTSRPVVTYRESILQKQKHTIETITAFVEPMLSQNEIENAKIFGTNVLINKTEDTICEDVWKQQMRSGPLCSEPMHKVVTTMQGMGTLTQYRQALNIALLNAKPVVLEPCLSIEIHVPNEFMGVVGKLIHSRAIKINDTTSDETKTIYKSHARVEQLLGFVEELKTITKGRSAFLVISQSFEPAKNQQTIITKLKMQHGTL